jgi:DNA-binding protein WhiA
MGAPMSALEVMNVKIHKDLRNKANRLANCDNANIDKQIKAAEKQLRNIELISGSMGGLDALPDDLKQLARLRKEYPEHSLTELGQLFSPPLTRAAVDYKFRKLADYAWEVRNTQ